jgi:FkbM family methyltransferase
MIGKAIRATRAWASTRSYFARRRAVARIREWNDRDQRALAFYSQFIHSAELCFDVGANRGNRTKVFQRIGSRVIAIEPQRHCVRILRVAFSGDPRVTVVEAACGDREGAAEILVATADTVSSLAGDWIAAVKSTGRFRSVDWVKRQPCRMTTLDRLIDEYGIPSFIKIDVEGFELSVLRGLSKFVPCVSFEFTPELITSATESVRHLGSLGSVGFNLSLGESMELLWRRWVSLDEIIKQLLSYEDNTSLFGDVYARFTGCAGTRRAGEV